MQTRIALLASTALAALALAAPADAKGNWYVNLTGGANFLDDENFAIIAGSSIFAANLDADTGWVISGAIGMNFGNVMSGLRGEIEVGYRQNQVDGNFTTNSAGTPQTGVLAYDHESFSVLANVWWDIPLGTSFSPYIGGGVGWGDTNVDGTFTCTFGFCTGTVAAFDNSEDGFAWQLGAGVNFAISPNVDLGVGYRFYQGPEPFLAAPFTTSFTHDVENQNHSAVVTLTFVM